MRKNKFRAWTGTKMVYDVYKEYDNLMQYTGLNDKNGKEIYEGDIVEINGHKYIIQYEIGSFMLVKCFDETDMYKEFESCWNDDVYPLTQFYWESEADEKMLHECEVIGNKYENPKFLEGEANE